MARNLLAVCLILAAACGCVALTGCGGSGGAGAYADGPPPQPPQTPENMKTNLDVVKNTNMNERLRVMACNTLGNMGSLASPAVADLEQIASADASEEVRKAAGEAVAKIKSGGAAPAQGS